MTRSQDQFPTRLERKLGMFERLDPVVHAPEERWGDGPLPEEKVREFDERGFLFFESFFDRSEMEKFIQELQEYEEDEDLKLAEGPSWSRASRKSGPFSASTRFPSVLTA
ncbi:MAG: hypothetical protein ACTMHG_04415 [Marinobacter sp.]